jgi:NADPH2:quinone reductase
LGQPDSGLAEKNGVSAIGQMTSTDANHLNRLSGLVDKGILRICVDKIFSFDQVKEAFRHAEQHHPRGKVVIKIR